MGVSVGITWMSCRYGEMKEKLRSFQTGMKGLSLEMAWVSHRVEEKWLWVGVKAAVA